MYLVNNNCRGDYMKFSTIMMMLGGVGLGGYYYFKKHPEIVNNMKCMLKDTSRKVYNMLDEEG